MFSIDIHTT